MSMLPRSGKTMDAGQSKSRSASNNIKAKRNERVEKSSAKKPLKSGAARRKEEKGMAGGAVSARSLDWMKAWRFHLIRIAVFGLALSLFARIAWLDRKSVV